MFTFKIKNYSPNLLKIPKIQMALFLLLIAISAVLYEKRFLSFLMIFSTVISTVTFDVIFTRLRKVKPILPSAAIVSGLIIGLLLDPTLPWYYAFITSAIAMASKNFLRYQNRHIFNPAAFGLLIAGLLFNKITSWWAVSFQAFRIDPISLFFFIILLSPGFVSMVRMRRYKILLAFFAAYVLLIGVLQSFQLTKTVLDPTIIFFGLVMLPEPMTSPNKPIRQILFGITVAAIAVLTGLLHTSFTFDPLITGLLVGNLIFFKFR